jgi:hypothetical protein
VAKARQQINVGGPGPDAVDGGQRRVRVVGSAFGKRGEREVAAAHRTGDGLERADFRRRQPDPGEPRAARAQDRCRVEGIERSFQPSPDGAGARGRKLLRYDDRGKASEAVGPPAERRPPGGGDQADEPGIDFSERGKTGVEIGLGMDMGWRHWLQIFPGSTSEKPIVAPT